MKISKLFSMIVAMFLVGVGATAFADCQEIRFSDGQSFCFDLQKVNSDTFQAKTSSNKVNDSDLNCNLMLPNGTTLALPKCEGEFTYRGSNGAITLRADTSSYYYELIANYDFHNGSFSTSSNSNYSNRYQAEFILVSNDRIARDQWIDVQLRVKNLDYSSSYYNGRVDFRVEEYRNGRWEQASSYDYKLDRSSYYFSSYENGEKRFDRFVKFKKNGEFRLYAEIPSESSTYKTFFIGTEKPSYTSYYPKWTSIKTNRPNQDERIDMSLEVKYNDSYYGNTPYEGRVDFRVEEYRNSRWEQASSYDYELDRSSYYFSSYDNGEKRFDRFVKFKKNGEFRVVAELYTDRNATAYQNFFVNTHSNNNSYYNTSVDKLSIQSVSPYAPRVDSRVDVTVRAVDRYGSLVRNYDSRIRFSIESYRNGYRYSADSSDYELDNYSHSFSRYDYGEKTFSRVLKFKRSGKFRIKVVDDYHSSIVGTQEVSVNYSNDNYDHKRNYPSGFTHKEIGKIKAVAEIWNGVIISLEKDYPRLRRSTEWKRLSNDFYSNMQDVLRNYHSGQFRDRDDFYNAFLKWFNYTVKTR